MPRAAPDPDPRPSRIPKQAHLPAALAFALLGAFGPRTASAEEGRVNLHLELGAGFLAERADAAAGVQTSGLALALKADWPVHRFAAPQLGYALLYLPGRAGTNAAVNLLLVGLRIRPINDEEGYRFSLWPRAAPGNLWGNLWVELGIGYAHTAGLRGPRDVAALELAVGYELSVVSPLQFGPYLSYRQIFARGSFPAFLSLGVTVSFGYPKPPQPTGEDRPAPISRPNVIGRRGDRDGDGVADRSDRCPSSPPGAAVDDVGCEPTTDKVIRVSLPLPPPGGELAPESAFELRRVAELLRANPRTTLEIRAAAPGSGATRRARALRRGRRVRQALIELGVRPRRLRVRSQGPGRVHVTWLFRPRWQHGVEMRFRRLPGPAAPRARPR